MNFRVPGLIPGIFALLFIPPFAFVSGLLLGVLLWFLLADAGLPTWARVALSVLVIPGLPGLWFLAMPILFWRNRMKPLELTDEVDAWQTAQFEAMERHQDAFAALRRQRIERVVAGGTSVSADGVEMTAVATELGSRGGVITIVQTVLAEVDAGPPDPGDRPEAMPFVGAITDLTDDVGTDYVVVVSVSEPIQDGGRTRIDFIPPPPPNARELRLTMRQLYVREGLVAPGPWEFTFALT